MTRFLAATFLCLVIPALATLTLGCRRDAAPDRDVHRVMEPRWLEDVTEKLKLDFVHDAGPTGDYFMPQQVGSGAALFDFNRDGKLDLYLLNNGGPRGKPNRLYRQQADGTFQDVSAESGLDVPGFNMGVAVGDVDRDGWPDVLITQYNGVKLFLNNRDSTFTDATREAGLDNPSWGSSAAFFDYDRDGWLDLVVVNYVDYDPSWPCSGPTGQRDYCAPATFRGRVTRLFHNVSSAAKGEKPTRRVRFADVTEPSGLGRLPGPGLGVVCADFDGDGWADVFVANDGKRNHLWINQKDGTFSEQAIERGIAYNAMGRAQAGMGVALGDVDGDGLFDLFVTHLSEETHTLWKQGPRGQFQDHTAPAGLISSSWRGTGFGTLLADLDHDGLLDLAIANGHVSARPPVGEAVLGPFWSRYGDRNQVFKGEHGAKFRDVSPDNPAFSGTYNVARGLVRGDVDGDGAQDLLVTTISGRARLFRNVAPKRGHWLQVRAVDPAIGGDDYGSEIRVSAGGKVRTVWLHPSESYLCSAEPCAHFGLGSVEQVDFIEVRWPDGEQERFPGGGVDRRRELHKGTGQQ